MKNALAIAALSLVFAPALTGCVTEEEENQNQNQTTNQNQNEPVIVDAPATIDVDTTWIYGIYTTPREFRVRSRLIIEPCSVIEVNDRVFVDEGGVIEAVGTEDCPIVFTSTASNPAMGDWRYIELSESAGNGHIFEHVIFEFGGNRDGAVQVKARAAFRHVEFREIDAVGVRVFDEGRLDEFTDVRFDGVEGSPIVVTSNAVAAIDGISIENSTHEFIRIRESTSQGALTRASTWEDQGVPFVFDGNFNNDYNVRASLTVGAGVEILFGNAGRLFVEETGSLNIQGTEDDPVTIQGLSSSPSAGDWQHISMAADANPSTLAWTTLRHGGNIGNVIRTRAPLTLENVTFEDNAGCDVDADGTILTATDSTFEEC